MRDRNNPWPGALLILAWLEVGLALLEGAYLAGRVGFVTSWDDFRPLAAVWAAVIVAAMLAVAVTARHRSGRGSRWGAGLAVALPPLLVTAAVLSSVA